MSTTSQPCRIQAGAHKSTNGAGVLTCVRRIMAVSNTTNWLDYGCGVGGLVQFLTGHGIPRAVGFEQGWSVQRLVEKDIPHLRAQDLPDLAGTFDVVTAIEVIEHAVDPLGELRKMRALLKPGEILFLTTGNAEPYRRNLSDWRYITPEVHISFFEPGTLALALDKAGFVAEYPGFGPGWIDLYRAKLLRTLRMQRTSPISSIAPWPILARAFEARLRLAQQPIGVANA